MSRLHVEAEGTAKATPAAVWALVADAATYHIWGPWSASGYDSSADHGPADHGPGSARAIRWMRYGGTKTVEEVLEVEVDRRLVYTVVKGIPVRNYRAEVTLTPVAAGTRIHWAADFDRTLLGRIVHRKLRTMYPEIMAQLVIAAERTELVQGQGL